MKKKVFRERYNPKTIEEIREEVKIATENLKELIEEKPKSKKTTKETK